MVTLLLLAGDINPNPGPPSTHQLNFTLCNARSASSITLDINKPALIQDFLLTNDTDLLALTETWLSPLTPQTVLNSLTPSNYSMIHVPRPSGTGGGLAVIFKTCLRISQIPVPTFHSFESLCVRLSLPSTSITILCVYRPPSSPKSNFFSEFATLLESLSSSPSELLLAGDFNFHLDHPIPTSDAPFVDLLDTFSLSQHVDFPTHISSHTLDLLITRSSSSLITSTSSTDFGISDHVAICSTLSIPIQTRPTRITKTVRCYRSIDHASFSNDIRNSSLFHSPASTLTTYLDQFNSTLTSILDKHAPLKTITCNQKTHKPFITEEIRLQKAKRSKLETIFRRTRQPADLLNLKTQSKHLAKLITSARRSHFKTLISDFADQPKKLWSCLNSLLSRHAPTTLPSTDSTKPSTLASSFLDHFRDKITKLSASFPPMPTFMPDPLPTPFPPVLSHFAPATTAEVQAAINKSSNSSCTLDVIPTFLLKACLDSLLVPITSIVNLSLSESTFPSPYKHAIVRPLLKKPSLPRDDLSSYRPISNLNFISKIVERIVANRLNLHLQSFPSISPNQSAYRKFHSTETALLRISNDILLASNDQKVTALILLDLSAAFDTIDYPTLLSRLSTTFGITGNALEFISSYRTQSVVIGPNLDCSSSSPLLTGVPQGSVLGPLLFSLYTTPLAATLSNFHVTPHFYADDTQLYISFSSNDFETSLRALTSALDRTYTWLTSNRLSVNPTKTEYLLIGTPQQRSKVLSTSIMFQDAELKPTSEARNLGIIFDSNLAFTKQISTVCHSSFYHIRQLRQIRSSLDTNSAIILANALVTSKLDYCNSLYYNLPKFTIHRLQRVQNSLARAVVPSVRYTDHITPTLQKLHWLPIEQRITFKIAALTYRTLHYKQPTYLLELLHPTAIPRTLRSSNQNLLDIPFTKSKTGRRAFSFAAPTIWKSLPLSLRLTSEPSLFFSRLKTHLFPP